MHFGVLETLGTYEIGELWCAVLLEMNRRIGPELGLRLVVDGMKGLQINPSLLDGRDAILLALDDQQDTGERSGAENAEAAAGIWAAFARFGMGVGATSQGPALAGAFADGTLP